MSCNKELKMKEYQNKIHPDTRLGYVHLTVSDLKRSISFYERALGFQVHEKKEASASLGAGRDDLLVLTEEPGAESVPKRTGLYHFAILVPSRLALAQSLKNMIETETDMQGFADHLVSEAIYLADPDGNGIEIYRDRPKAAWEYENGRLKMGTEPLDIESVLAELNNYPQTWQGLQSETVLGHMHLHVANLQAAQEFYQETLRFDLMVNLYGSAAFLSAGGYHHHVGINTWNGVGAPPPPPGAVGLRYFMIKLPDSAALYQLLTRLNEAHVVYENSNGGVFVRDPSENGIKFIVDSE
jgi:catechol 2,3-dioxygenase